MPESLITDEIYRNRREIDLTNLDLKSDVKALRKAYGKAKDQQAIEDAYFVSGFREHIQPGDRVFHYSSIGLLSGSAGYVLVRGEQVISRVYERRS